VLSHFILDFIPHGDERLYRDEEWKINKKYKRVAVIGTIDASLVVLMTMILYSTNDLPQMALISAGLIGSILPDILSHFMPIFHEKMNWLFVVRWLHALLKGFQIIRFNRLHNAVHGFLHNLMKFRLSPKLGLSLQGLITIASLMLAFGFKLIS